LEYLDAAVQDAGQLADGGVTRVQAGEGPGFLDGGCQRFPCVRETRVRGSDVLALIAASIAMV
jgi:hypothetical protein